MKRVITGNEAVAHGALRAGVAVAAGYPGTPSTGCLATLEAAEHPDRHVEWSTNEKVAFEITAGAAWAGRRALATMKMSGLNVAYDAVISVAYSGTNGGLVLYVADDPGAGAGMAEQDTRGFALISDLPILEPDSPESAYRMAQAAFELSEDVGTPVILRLTTAVALGSAIVDIEDPVPPSDAPPILEREIARYTKAGSAICRAQHQDLIDRLARAADWIDARGLHRLVPRAAPGGLGIIAVGAAAASLAEGLAAAGRSPDDVSILRVAATVPFPSAAVRTLIDRVDALLVLEELEPHLERGVWIEARRSGFRGPIVGKLDGTLPRIGEYGVAEVVRGLAACGVGERRDAEDAWIDAVRAAERVASSRTITVCAGCPHRGTYMAIEAAIEAAGFARSEVMVTGDIGCTILGMNPPFDLLWNEVSMGSSVSIAQGYVHAGVQTPVIATIGDSTLFHGGIPGVLNAIQRRVPMTVIVMDNGWTSMTGMQANPGTDEAFQRGGRRVDLAALLPALGADGYVEIDPFDFDAAAKTIAGCLTAGGVQLVLARRECAIQAARRGELPGRLLFDPARCIVCRRCLTATGCPALGLDDGAVSVDAERCTGCGLCTFVCPTGALRRGEAG